MKIELLADYWNQRKKDADGEVYYQMHHKGDEVEVNEAEARHLLRDDLPRPMARKVDGDKKPAVKAPVQS